MFGTRHLRSTEKLYVFGGRYVTCTQSRPKSDSAIMEGTFKTKNMSIEYAIISMSGTKCMLLKKTHIKYPVALLRNERKALTEAIRQTAEESKLKVLQTSKRPDYGFEGAEYRSISVRPGKN
jgi:hypothetical protein